MIKLMLYLRAIFCSFMLLSTIQHKHQTYNYLLSSWMPNNKCNSLFFLLLISVENRWICAPSRYCEWFQRWERKEILYILPMGVFRAVLPSKCKVFFLSFLMKPTLQIVVDLRRRVKLDQKSFRWNDNNNNMIETVLI